MRFLAMTNHYVFEPEFCNPAAGWEKGRVEKNVRDSRDQILQGLPTFPGLVALNDWLEQSCLELWRQTAHGTLPDMIADVWAEEQAALMPLPPAFDGFIELSKRVSPTCLISFEHEEDQETIRGDRFPDAKATAFRRHSPTVPSACGSIQTGWLSRPKAVSCANIPA
ncbi:hypothetical protein PAA8504_03699 [Palleronia abyssalis]|uniref:Uncharacterized protein n=1 Tax=Palleronia abyssalis TaxID=1501240 RepID=A0A2R8C0B4_9RHOB|nr:hypothetical protein PAA8504_03699 [Palleronia abyssalis]